MSIRLMLVLYLLLVCVLASLGIPLAYDLAHRDVQRVFDDRLQDAGQFASEAAASDSNTDDIGLEAKLRRYDQVYGLPVFVLDLHGHPYLSAGGLDGLRHLDRAVVPALLSGGQVPPPAFAWPG